MMFIVHSFDLGEYSFPPSRFYIAREPRSHFSAFLNERMMWSFVNQTAATIEMRSTFSCLKSDSTNRNRMQHSHVYIS